ncbi:MAG TPA: hypothetical protein EYG97_00860 [Arcobacter sp.]|nr:hypothetical protein [Arcobacter sp.]HIP55554.1 hypothetical protein [Arcobacter sp.]
MKKLLINILLLLSISSLNILANETSSKVDCVLLKDENSIICKYTHERVNMQKTVRFEWHEPDGVVSRVRAMVIPAGHGSVYDYRYIKGRTSGLWTLKVLDNNEVIKTTFIIE